MKLYTLHQVITLYQLTHSLISPYKKSTEKLYKLDNAEVVCVIPELDASSSVGDGTGIFKCGHYQELKKIPMKLWIQEGVMGQTGNRPVLPL